ncbi:MAG TPA: ABC transporter ATP-binding protein [Nannocystis exedens]|nr:ABC transporter ATP-binding protein [Nannocystis exedens]
MMARLTIDIRTIRRVADGQKLLEGVSLVLEPGERVGVVGASGSGKSLFLRALVGLLPPALRAEGELQLGAMRYDLEDQRCLAKVRGRGLALLSQAAASSLDPTRRIDSQLREVERAAGLQSTLSCRVAALQRVGLQPAIGQAFAHRLSGGEAQRVALCLALAAGPQVLLADEPTSNLDTLSAAQVLRALDDAPTSSALSLLLVSHDLAEVTGRCQRIIVLEHGRVAEAGPTANILHAAQAAATRRLVSAAQTREHALSALLKGEAQ